MFYLYRGDIFLMSAVSTSSFKCIIFFLLQLRMIKVYVLVFPDFKIYLDMIL